MTTMAYMMNIYQLEKGNTKIFTGKQDAKDSANKLKQLWVDD